MKKKSHTSKSFIKDRIEETLELLAILLIIFTVIVGFFVSGYYIFN